MRFVPPKVYSPPDHIHLRSMPEKHTSLVVYDGDLWAWAQYRAKTLGFRNASEYLLGLVGRDRRGGVRWPGRRKSGRGMSG